MPSTTIIVASLYILFGVASLAIWVLFLRLGLMWARAEDVSFSRLSVAVVLSYLLSKAVLILAYFVSPRILVAVLSMVLIESAIAVAVQCFVIKFVFKLTYPRAIQAWLPTLGTSYQSTSPSMFSIPDELWGSESRPAQLDEDEYFVLGDFSASSRDSRHWEQGAPGHNAFAVPESHLRGVVTHIYWPPSRWRAFR